MIAKLDDLRVVISEFTKLSTAFYDSVLHTPKSFINIMDAYDTADQNSITIMAPIHNSKLVFDRFEIIFQREDKSSINEIYFHTDLAKIISIKILTYGPEALEFQEGFENFAFIPIKKSIPSYITEIIVKNGHIRFESASAVNTDDEIKFYCVPYSFNKYGIKKEE